jgi:hypothetical protein
VHPGVLAGPSFFWFDVFCAVARVRSLRIWWPPHHFSFNFSLPVELSTVAPRTLILRAIGSGRMEGERAIIRKSQCNSLKRDNFNNTLRPLQSKFLR